MKHLVALFALLLLCAGCSTVSYQSLAPLPGEVLSTHKTQARYDGLRLEPCRFMTAQCPNECDHGGFYASFTVLAYHDYTSPSTYGDEPQQTFAVRMSLRNGQPAPETPLPLQKVIESLHEGDTVELDWTHVYVSDDSGKHPERIVTVLRAE